MKKKLLFPFFLIIYLIAYAEIPGGYYNDVHEKKNDEIKTGLHTIIREHTYLNYGASSQIWWYTYFRQTDWYPEGYFWDMYSNEKRPDYIGTAQNKEHCMPRSWWQIGNGNYGDANGDLFNLYPSDATANRQKSNHPLGMVGTATFNNGVVKVGSSSLDGYEGTVFEPADEYKGDFARTYMYMVTCYEDFADRWTSTGTASMLENNTYPTFNQYAIDLLMKWHADDPVSEKETDRNEKVYELQGNRNPFIDLPEIADYIWGSKRDEIWFYWTEPVSIDYIAEKNYAIIYSDRNLIIESSFDKMIEYAIYSMEGRLLNYSKSETNTSCFIDLPQGFYIIEVRIENGFIHEKIFIK